MIGRRKKIYMEAGGVRTDEWHTLKSVIEEKIIKRKRGFFDTQRQHILSEDANRNFFKHVKNFSTVDKPEIFNIRTLRPGVEDADIAEELAVYFNSVSQEFQPLQASEIPSTRSERLPVLEKHEVAKRILKFRKPKSMVRGDIFPSLMTLFSDFFAIPLTSIFNEIASTFTWPDSWKEESVTVIPKKTRPESFGDLRNISCTKLASKIFESYVLDWTKEKVRLKNNQYGGVKGVGTDHLLVQMWQEVLENAEDYRAGTVITSIDYAKAFNRMSFQHCLKALAKKGATSEHLKLIATFLTRRMMSVRVGEAWSKPREVTGGGVPARIHPRCFLV